MMHIIPLKFPLKILYLFSEIRVGLGAFGKPFSTFTLGELEPQFASENSYFGYEIKQVCRSIWRVTNHT